MGSWIPRNTNKREKNELLCPSFQETKLSQLLINKKILNKENRWHWLRSLQTHQKRSNCLKIDSGVITVPLYSRMFCSVHILYTTACADSLRSRGGQVESVMESHYVRAVHVWKENDLQSSQSNTRFHRRSLISLRCRM